VIFRAASGLTRAEDPGEIVRIHGQVVEKLRFQFLPGVAAIYRPVDVIAPSTTGQDVEILAV
jgi:hypothetical protein